MSLHSNRVDLYAAIVIALLAMGMTLAGINNGALKALVSLPLVLWLPGYALTSALRLSLDVAQKILFSIGLSIVLTIGVGLALNYLPVGLSSLAWAVVLGTITLICALIALFRQRNILQSYPSAVNLSLPQSALLACAALITLLAIVIARAGVGIQDTPFTQFWMLPDKKPQVIILGIHNYERTPVNYKIDLMIGSVSVYEWPSIALAADGEWQAAFDVPDKLLTAGTLDAQLYRSDQPNIVYRHTALRLLSLAQGLPQGGGTN